MTARPRRHAVRLLPAGVRLLLAGTLMLTAALAGCTAGPSAAGDVDGDGDGPAIHPVASPVPGGVLTLPGPAPTDLGLRPAPTDSPPAPAVSGTLTDRTPLELADLWAERAVVLTFFTSWCTLCADQQRALSDLARANADRVVFVGVVGAEDDPAQVRDYLHRHRVEHPVLVDDDQTIWRAYAVREPPAVVLIAKGGVLLRGFPGGVDTPTLTDLLATL
ncbi:MULTISPECIES: TlpA family protein disulfide reductase [unclassified Solwaraspora]|uniref:TlpA family protein disulfide reductase n=1 Tax=unclassified Solwaraspora TaxID=2627926 RepID=UPI00259B5787|nr:TlpA disulfide reductase family protein [Solwaraspora sp. WMMA2056]WJK42761.1 TlpA disulfide reductase family protein [Solwaraspora sp. WMMA2056]